MKNIEMRTMFGTWRKVDVPTARRYAENYLNGFSERSQAEKMEIFNAWLRGVTCEELFAPAAVAVQIPKTQAAWLPETERKVTAKPRIILRRVLATAFSLVGSPQI